MDETLATVPAPSEIAEIEGEGSLFTSMLQASQDYIGLLDIDGRIRFINDHGLTLIDAQEFSAIVGWDWSQFWPDEYKPALARAIKAAAGGQVGRFRAWRPTRSGRPKWWDTAIAPVTSRSSGKVIRLLAVCRDVTSQIHTQTFLDTIIDAVPTVLFAKDATDGRYLLLNREAEGIFGMPREMMLGKNDLELGVEGAEGIRKFDEHVIASREVVVVEEMRHLGDAGPRLHRARLQATYGEEGPRHIVGLIDDITEQRAAEKALALAAERAEAANRSKSEFLANMSHEIRTPLNGVVGIADVLARSDLSPSDRELVEIIRSSGQTLDRLLSDVLDVSRIESGRLEIQREPFHLADVVRTVATLAEPLARRKDLSLIVDIAGEAEAWVMGDVVRVNQILTNLVSNAIKFTEQGQVRLTVECEPDGTDAVVARFVVRDTGVGFDPTNKDAIFGRFQQADGSITRRFGGSGLGMSISKQLAEMMDGTMDCDSTPGEGSVFSLRLPMQRAQSPAEAAAQAAPAETIDTRAPLRVLLAEDHAINRKVVALMLSQVGAELTSVEDGAQALKAFESARFDVVLMDMQMPVMDGLTATRAIRARERLAGLQPTPIFMLTANALGEHVEACRQAGADLHISKPVTSAALLAALAKVDRTAGRAAA